MPKPSVSIAIPAFNEEETLAEVAGETIREIKKITDNYEIVLVDDGSTDKTGRIIDTLSKKNKKIRGLHHKKNKGFTGAIKTALYSSKKNFVFLAPADGQFNFSELPKFIKAMKGSDVAVGYRVNKYNDPARRLFTIGFHFLARMILGIPLKEFSTVFMWKRSALKKIKINADDRSAMFLPEFFAKAVRADMKFSQVPIHWRERGGGISKLSGYKAAVVISKTFFGMIKLRMRLRD